MADRLLVLDQSTSVTGYCEWVPGEHFRLGHERVPKTFNDVGLFLAKYEDWLTSMIVRLEPTLIVFERPWIGPKTHQQTALKLMALAGFIEYVCRKNDVRYREALVRNWRKHFIGSGNYPRKQAQTLTRDACARFNIFPRNQDEADAFGILDYVAAKLDLAPDWGKSDFSAGALFRNGRATE